jgi:purine-binding chemotaxis protein CheW
LLLARRAGLAFIHPTVNDSARFVQQISVGILGELLQNQGREQLRAITLAPHAPPDVAGIINLRGRIVTVVDAGMKLGYGPTAPGQNSRVFIVEDRDEFLGLLVDRVGEVLEVESGTEEPMPANLRPAQSRYFKGVNRIGGRVIALLDSAEMLAVGP